MRNTTSALLIVVGLLILWMAVTGRLENLAPAWDALKRGADKGSGWGGGSSGTFNSNPSPGRSIPWPLNL